MDERPADELETLLDKVSNELTTARAIGFDDTARLREALRRARNLVDESDALVASIEIAKRGPAASID